MDEVSDEPSRRRAPRETHLRDIVMGRRSVRRFLPDRIDPGLVDDLLATALWAPSPHNAQPWRFMHVEGVQTIRLARAMGDALRRELESEGLAESQITSQVDRSYQRITCAPHTMLCSLVEVGLNMNGQHEHDRLELQMAVQSVGAVLQTFFLLAWERGLGTCWMAAPMYCQQVVRSVLDLPDSHLPQALVLVGYPADSGRRRPRREIRRMVS